MAIALGALTAAQHPKPGNRTNDISAGADAG
jgi:hypothetical protein